VPSAPANPFRVSGVVDDEYFTDRTRELARLRAALADPGGKLLVYGPRRMGKTSALARAVRQTNAARAPKGGQRAYAALADLSTASTLADVANRVLEAVAGTLGRTWRTIASDLAAALNVAVKLAPDPATGLSVPSLELSLRRADAETQRATFARVLDTIERLAADRGVTIGLALDEFQEITRFGGEDAEWHLRGVVQHHRHVAYVFAGSRVHLIRRMLAPSRAFFELCDVLPFGPIEAGHLAAWIERRLRDAGVGAAGIGARVVEVAGPRTRDVVQLARATFDRAARAGVARAADVDAAFQELVETRDDEYRAFWGGLTPAQQNVLRAVAVQPTGLTQTETIARFGLPTSGGVVKALERFVDEGRLVRDEAGAYTFDSPYLRAWVVSVTLPDLGVH
jgi:uncharacterized protein